MIRPWVEWSFRVIRAKIIIRSSLSLINQVSEWICSIIKFKIIQIIVLIYKNQTNHKPALPQPALWCTVATTLLWIFSRSKKCSKWHWKLSSPAYCLASGVAFRMQVMKLSMQKTSSLRFNLMRRELKSSGSSYKISYLYNRSKRHSCNCL